MENPTHNSEDSWVGDKLSTLVPPSDWHPDTKCAYARLLNRKDRNGAEGTPRWIQLSMAAAILASIGLVITLLPWQALWRPATSSKTRPSSEIVIATTPAPPAQPQTSAAPPATQQAQKPVEKSGPDVIRREIISPSTEPNSTDEARRAHILATVAAVQQTPARSPSEQEQKPVQRVGPGVTPPRAIRPLPEPDYTDEARQAHIQGTVVLDVTIRADGTGKVNKVERGLGYGLDEKAIQTFEKWRFTPGMVDGKPVDVQLQVTINFHLY